ncbi:septum formation initiator family protein [Candidatus Saccharibacteria bacterium]|nr:septum formation initiator family protein [Candidatus Saccharibacteria bacterium]
MFEQIKNVTNNKRVKQLLDPRNIALYIFGVIVLAIAWSGANTVQSNYELQKEIATLKQQNQVIALQNGNTYLQNQFYKTNEYLELSARQNLGLALPGEQVLVVPKSTSMKYIDPKLRKQSNPARTTVKDTRPKYKKNLEAWRDFLLGRTPIGG